MLYMNVILPVAPLWCDLGFFPNSRGNKAAANLRPSTESNVITTRAKHYTTGCVCMLVTPLW